MRTNHYGRRDKVQPKEHRGIDVNGYAGDRRTATEVSLCKAVATFKHTTVSITDISASQLHGNSLRQDWEADETSGGEREASATRMG